MSKISKKLQLEIERMAGSGKEVPMIKYRGKSKGPAIVMVKGQGIIDLAKKGYKLVKPVLEAGHKIIKDQKLLSKFAEKQGYKTIADVLRMKGYGPDDTLVLKKGDQTMTLTKAEALAGSGSIEDMVVGSGLGSWLSKGWKLVKKGVKAGVQFAKDTGIVSKALALSGNPVSALVAERAGYGAGSRKGGARQANPLYGQDSASVSLGNQSNAGISTGVAGAGRMRKMSVRSAGVSGSGMQLGAKPVKSAPAHIGVGPSGATQHQVVATF